MIEKSMSQNVIEIKTRKDDCYKKKVVNMNIQLNDGELQLLREIIHTDVQASLSILREERDLEHAWIVTERIVMCNVLLRVLEG